MGLDYVPYPAIFKHTFLNIFKTKLTSGGSTVSANVVSMPATWLHLDLLINSGVVRQQKIIAQLKVKMLYVLAMQFP